MITRENIIVNPLYPWRKERQMKIKNVPAYRRVHIRICTKCYFCKKKPAFNNPLQGAGIWWAKHYTIHYRKNKVRYTALRSLESDLIKRHIWQVVNTDEVQSVEDNPGIKIWDRFSRFIWGRHQRAHAEDAPRFPSPPSAQWGSQEQGVSTPDPSGDASPPRGPALSLGPTALQGAAHLCLHLRPGGSTQESNLRVPILTHTHQQGAHCALVWGRTNGEEPNRPPKCAARQVTPPGVLTIPTKFTAWPGHRGVYLPRRINRNGL